MFDDMIVNMIDIGEETGELDKMLMKIADHYADDVDIAVESLTSIIEPVLSVVNRRPFHDPRIATLASALLLVSPPMESSRMDVNVMGLARVPSTSKVPAMVNWLLV